MSPYNATEYRGAHGAYVHLRREKWGARWRWYYSDASWTRREAGPIRSKFGALLEYANRCGYSGRELNLCPVMEGRA